ncbi:hypothetical protein [Oerskovia paurometabola]|uniref:hypothetical protein n=1 Tax=Oerskovia paurometabola TaxID=162170 RepID=UPI0038052304
MGTRDAEVLAAALRPDVVARYTAHVHRSPTVDCWIWTGAISGKGHGRFWVSDRFVVIAHRFGYALAHPGIARLPAVVRHVCDTPPCQNPAHWAGGDHAANRQEWSARRHTPRSPLRDTQGSLGRSLALRDAARERDDLEAAERQGVRPVDREQSTLW